MGIQLSTRHKRAWDRSIYLPDLSHSIPNISTDFHEIPVNYIKVPLTIINSYGSVSKPCTPVVHIKIAGKWMFIPLKMVLIGIDH